MHSFLLKHADTINELLPKFNPTVEREGMKKWTEDGGPFGNKGNKEDKAPQAPTPLGPNTTSEHSEKDEKWMGEMGVKQSTNLDGPLSRKRKQVRNHNDKPPREDLTGGNNRVRHEMDEELERDNSDDNVKARKVGSLHCMSNLFPSFEFHDQHMVLHIPKSAKKLDLTTQKINQMENQISKVLNVRAKYDHISIGPGFHGVSLEFLLV